MSRKPKNFRIQNKNQKFNMDVYGDGDTLSLHQLGRWLNMDNPKQVRRLAKYLTQWADWKEATDDK